MIRAAGGARDALLTPSMLPRLEYYGDPADDEDEDEETRMLREGQLLVDDSDDDPLLDTRLMPAKHGAKSPTLASHGRLQVPSPYPSAPKQHASGVQRKVTPPPPPPMHERTESPELPALFAELYSSVEPTGSDVHAPIHRMDGAAALPSTTALAARRAPWVIQVTPPEFQPLPLPTIEPPRVEHIDRRESAVAPAVTSATEKKSHKASAIVGGLLGIVCGALIVSIVNGTITQKDARSALGRATHVLDAIIAHH